jgi:hypothetical protein
VVDAGLLAMYRPTWTAAAMSGISSPTKPE